MKDDLRAEGVADVVIDALSFSARAWLIDGALAPEMAGHVVDELRRYGLTTMTTIDDTRAPYGRMTLTPAGRRVQSALRNRAGRRVRRPARSPKARTDRPPRRLEKHEQLDAQRLFAQLGGTVYVIGTRRPRGRKCPSCHTFVPEHQGTCQTPGIADLLVFLPRRGAPGLVAVFVEMKATDGRLRAAQADFRAQCQAANLPHVTGTFEEVLAWLVAEGYVRADGLAHYRKAAKDEPSAGARG